MPLTKFATKTYTGLAKHLASSPGRPKPVLTKPPTDEFSALNTLIHHRSDRWSRQARAIKFDIEFKAIEQERRRVAKELHDEVLPLLARLLRAVQGSSNGCDKANQSLVDKLHSTVAAFRDLLGELHPVDLEELGLVPALESLCKRYARFSGRSILFAGAGDDCSLSVLQQLCLYRAMQVVLRMFVDSDNDLLVVGFERRDADSMITLRCVDKRVASADWLSPQSRDFDTFEAWCAMACAKVESGANEGGTGPYDLAVSASDSVPPKEDVFELIGQLSQIRLQELDTIMAFAQEEWARLINEDCLLFKNLAIEVERKRISGDINRLILPGLSALVEFSERSADESVRSEVARRMKVIENGVNAVITELHPRLLSEAGLLPSITALVERFRRASLIDTTVISSLSVTEVEDILLDAKFAIYRVTQEALNNIEKHSKATRALVTVRHDSGELVICIEDNGMGFQGSGSTLSRGLRIIRERAFEIGATVTWGRPASFATGTLVTISLRNADQKRG